MALINCPECGKETSDKATTCPNCGCPIKRAETKIMVKASSQFIGVANAYIIYDNNDNEVARLKPSESFVATLPDEKVTYSVKLKAAFGKKKDMVCEPNTINRFNVSLSQTGMGFVVSKVDMFDAKD